MIHQIGLPEILIRTIVFQIGTKACHAGSSAFLKMPISATAKSR
jgi:hypothetical protein